MLKHQIKKDRIVIEVPETATAEDINRHANELKAYCPEAAYLPLNYVMIDSQSF